MARKGVAPQATYVEALAHGATWLRNEGADAS